MSIFRSLFPNIYWITVPWRCRLSWTESHCKRSERDAHSVKSMILLSGCYLFSFLCYWLLFLFSTTLKKCSEKEPILAFQEYLRSCFDMRILCFWVSLVSAVRKGIMGALASSSQILLFLFYTKVQKYLLRAKPGTIKIQKSHLPILEGSLV